MRCRVKKLPKSLANNLAEAKKKMRKELIHHFKKDGWDLDFLTLVSTLEHETLGIDFGMHVLDAAKGIADLTVKRKTGNVMLVKRKKGKRR